ncbi:MAG: aminopeptidase P N-terminal domain-containing protein [Gemmatimonadales bacterium]|nr:aminopeptidase P N-terminal domain-containing protein [Gemmatimonadales bacterium]
MARRMWIGVALGIGVTGSVAAGTGDLDVGSAGWAQPVPTATYASRRSAVLAAAGSRVVVVPAQSAFKTDDQAGFQQTTDFYYLTGVGDVVGAVLVLDGPAGATVLFAPPSSRLITRPMPTPGPATAARLGLDLVLPVDSLESWLRRRLPAATEVLVSPTDPRGVVAMPVPMANGVERWRHYLGGLGFRGAVGAATTVIRPLRERKDAAEVAILDRVGRMSGQAMIVGIRALEPGRTQRQVEVAVVKSCVDAGGRHSFWPWAMSGPRAVYGDLFNSFVDYDGHDRVMRPGELVRVDVGCQAERYLGDVGRTAPVGGRFDPGQREAWDLFIAGYRAGLPLLRDGVAVAEVFAAALDRIRALAPTLRTPLGRQAAAVLLGPTGTEAWQFHGVGLDDAEGAPAVLRASMTVAYELMFAVGDQGFYLEDMILIERAGYRLLTPGLPYTAAEIERVMRD